eukprot:scaffold5169_cov366-Prasinococcus_capsulatus_cf.AAC.1
MYYAAGPGQREPLPPILFGGKARLKIPPAGNSTHPSWMRLARLPLGRGGTRAAANRAHSGGGFVTCQLTGKAVEGRDGGDGFRGAPHTGGPAARVLGTPRGG